MNPRDENIYISKIALFQYGKPLAFLLNLKKSHDFIAKCAGVKNLPYY
jgi:hypothetical protein